MTLDERHGSIYIYASSRLIFANYHLDQGQSTLEQCGVKRLAQEHNGGSLDSNPQSLDY